MSRARSLRTICLPLALAVLLLLPAAAQAYWGAIAIQPETGVVGSSSLKPTQAAAKRAAKSDCGDRHCKVGVWVSNGWGAMVLKDNGIYVSGLGNSKAEAFANARRRAHDGGARRVAAVFSGLS